METASPPATALRHGPVWASAVTGIAALLTGVAALIFGLAGFFVLTAFADGNALDDTTVTLAAVGSLGLMGGATILGLAFIAFVVSGLPGIGFTVATLMFAGALGVASFGLSGVEDREIIAGFISTGGVIVMSIGIVALGGDGTADRGGYTARKVARVLAFIAIIALAAEWWMRGKRIEVSFEVSAGLAAVGGGAFAAALLALSVGLFGYHRGLPRG
jgi:hypothetical protein